MGLAYYISALISTLIICFITFVLSMIYLHSIGWYMSGTDIRGPLDDGGHVFRTGMGSKVGDAAFRWGVVEAKSCLERIREQIQNVE